MKKTLSFFARLIGAFLLSGAAVAQLTPLNNSSVGSAVGQITGIQGQSSNLLLNTSFPSTGVGGSWTVTGSAASLTLANWTFDPGFTPFSITAADNTSSFSNASFTAVQGTTKYTFSAYISVDPAFGVSPQSTLVQLALAWDSGRIDYIYVNPGNGIITASSASVTAISSTSFTSMLPNILAQSTPNAPVRVIRVSFTTSAPGAAHSVTAQIFPHAQAGTASSGIMLGGVQLENSPSLSAYIPTNPLNTGTRVIGQLPTQNIMDVLPSIYTPTNYTYSQGVDAGKNIIMTVSGKVVALPELYTSALTLSHDGESFTVTNGNTGTTTIAATSGAPILGPNTGPSGATSITLPPTGSGATIPSASYTFVFDGPGNVWRIVSDNLSAGGGGGGGGSGCVPSSGNTNDVLFITAGNGCAGSNLFAWDGAKVLLNANTASLPPVTTGTELQLGQADTVPALQFLDSFGTNSGIVLRRTDGTAASPTAVQTPETIGTINFRGYNGSSYTASAGATASVTAFAAENFSTSNQGTGLRVNTTANGTNTIRASSTFDQDGSLKELGDIYVDDNGTNYFQLTGSPTSTDVWTLQNTTDTFVGRATTDTLTNKTLTSPVIGTIVNTGTLTLPTSTDTLVGRATTDTLTNKTYNTAGTGNVFQINGVGITAVTGTGSVALSTLPSFTGLTIASGTNFNTAGSRGIVAIAPTISSGFGSSPSIVHGASSFSFSVNVGTGGIASSGVIGMPTATAEWNCMVSPFNPNATQLLNTTIVSARATNSITLANELTSTGVATAWSASQVLMIVCGGA